MHTAAMNPHSLSFQVGQYLSTLKSTSLRRPRESAGILGDPCLAAAEWPSPLKNASELALYDRMSIKERSGYLVSSILERPGFPNNFVKRDVRLSPISIDERRALLLCARMPSSCCRFSTTRSIQAIRFGHCSRTIVNFNSFV